MLRHSTSNNIEYYYAITIAKLFYRSSSISWATKWIKVHFFAETQKRDYEIIALVRIGEDVCWTSTRLKN